jgi:hypothetical protein
MQRQPPTGDSFNCYQCKLLVIDEAFSVGSQQHALITMQEKVTVRAFEPGRGVLKFGCQGVEYVVNRYAFQDTDEPMQPCVVVHLHLNVVVSSC